MSAHEFTDDTPLDTPRPDTSGRETTPGPTAQPSDNTTLVEVVDSYRAAGYITEFWVEEGSTVRCDGCQSTLDSKRLPVLSQRRLEGASDPADMVVVVATSCPVCGADGTMVLGYGPMASGEDADVLVTLGAPRGNDLPDNAAPDEVPDLGQ